MVFVNHTHHLIDVTLVSKIPGAITGFHVPGPTCAVFLYLPVLCSCTCLCCVSVPTYAVFLYPPVLCSCTNLFLYLPVLCSCTYLCCVPVPTCAVFLYLPVLCSCTHLCCVAAAGERLMDLTSRDGDWFLEELSSISGNVNHFLNTLERNTSVSDTVGSNPCRSSRRIFFSRVDFLCWLLFWYPFHPHVTVTCKRPWSFCQKCRWRVTAEHAYTLCMWLCMKWHGAWLYGVHRTCAETAAVSCGTSHASAVSTPLRWIFNNKNAL